MISHLLSHCAVIKFCSDSSALTQAEWLQWVIHTWRQRVWLPPAPWETDTLPFVWRELLQNLTSLSYSSFLHTQSQRPRYHRWQPKLLPPHSPSPPLGPLQPSCMSLEDASDVSSSTGLCASTVGPWWMPLVWETAHWVWSGTHSTWPARTHPTSNKQARSFSFCCPSHTMAIKEYVQVRHCSANEQNNQ